MTPTRVLVVRVGAMGDVLHALPAVAALRASRPEWTIDWIVDPRWAPLLVGADGRSPLLSGVRLAETRLWSRAPVSRQTLASVLQLRRVLRTGRYDAVIDMQGTLRSALLGSFADAKVFGGFADPREAPARLLYKQRIRRRGAHVVQQGAALLGDVLGFPVEPSRSVPLPVDAVAEDQAERMVAGLGDGEPFALLAPTAGWGAKQWPAVRFGELAQALRARGLRVLVNAPPGGEPVSQAVVAASAGTAWIAPCTLPELVALTRRAAMVIGGDSGPVHLAAAVGIPVVALYGPTDPARNGPWGSGAVRVWRDPGSVTSYKRTTAVEAGLARISVAAVVGAAEELLSPQAFSR